MYLNVRSKQNAPHLVHWNHRCYLTWLWLQHGGRSSQSSQLERVSWLQLMEIRCVLLSCIWINLHHNRWVLRVHSNIEFWAILKNEIENLLWLIACHGWWEILSGITYKASSTTCLICHCQVVSSEQVHLFPCIALAFKLVPNVSLEPGETMDWLCKYMYGLVTTGYWAWACNRHPYALHFQGFQVFTAWESSWTNGCGCICHDKGDAWPHSVYRWQPWITSMYLTFSTYPPHFAYLFML